jgi:hypothetical protein
MIGYLRAYLAGQQVTAFFLLHAFSAAPLHFASCLSSQLVAQAAPFLSADFSPVPQLPQCALAVAAAARSKKEISIFFIGVSYLI